MEEYEALNAYQKELVSYVYGNHNMKTYPEVIAWLDEHCLNWREHGKQTEGAKGAN